MGEQRRSIDTSSHGGIPGVVLAGGLARRMGGGDKTLLPLGGRCILDHILGRLAPQCGPLAVNANGDPARFGRGVAVLADGVPGFPGPLAGILAAMDWAADLGAAQVVTVAGDTPFLPCGLVARLSQAALPDRPCLAASGSGALQPTIGLWPVSLRVGLRVDLLGSMRRVQDWALQRQAIVVPFPDDDMAFFNINTPEDLRHAAACLAQGGHDDS